MYGILKKLQGKRGGAKRGRAHPQKLVPGLGRVFRRNLALLRKRVKFVNPARAREKKEKNRARMRARVFTHHVWACAQCWLRSVLLRGLASHGNARLEGYRHHATGIQMK